ncbi:hypothetical protein HYPSUDRAFT_54836 [Hypholoma sublateritium FD-334 SS-4]|uniref:Uncharacterized protein n=1 Tax=Hypholoma sublateritium (strain FD-334 SS-4) TaxID=945553 RepID=A0A0D2MFV7_HYPSF|nr:hypothetical protein HYPSUDRAFT_54836 [Hypholoma sublateritium FD-334 SS-4]
MTLSVAQFLGGALDVLWSLTPHLLVNFSSSATGLAYLFFQHWAGAVALCIVLIMARTLWLIFSGLAELGFRAVPYVQSRRGGLSGSFAFNLPVAPQSASVVWRIVSGNAPLNYALLAVCAIYAAAHLYFPGEDYGNLFRGLEVTKRPAVWCASFHSRLSTLLDRLPGRGAEDMRARQDAHETNQHALVTCFMALAQKLDSMSEMYAHQQAAIGDVLELVHQMYTDCNSQLDKVFGLLESEGRERKALSTQLMDQDAILAQVKHLKNEVDARTTRLSVASVTEKALREELSAKQAQEEVLVSQIAGLQKDAVTLKLKHVAERDSLLRHFEQNANAHMNWARSVQSIIGSSQQLDLHASIEELP